MTVFEEENKGKRSRPNREVIIYSLLSNEQIISLRFGRGYFVLSFLLESGSLSG